MLTLDRSRIFDLRYASSESKLKSPNVMIYLNSTNNCYEIQGLPLCDIVQEYGAPLFIYDAQKIIDQYTKMTNALRGVKKVKINYACKALTNINILKLFKSLGAGLDAVSYQEILLGLEAGFEPDSIIFTPNSISVNELEAAIAKGVKMNIDNLENLEYMGMHYPEIPLCVRINPHIMAGGNANISVGHIDSKFGISIHQVPHIERLVESLGIHIEGVHMHTGSDILDVDVFAHAADLLFSVARRFEDLQYIDFGSGFKVKYQEQDIETDIDAFGLMMTQKFNDFCQETGRELVLAFEPGKFLVSEAGYFIASTNVIKQTTSAIFAGIDSGFNHMIRPMFYDAYHQIINLSNPSGKPKLYTVVGYICETDTFGWNRKINKIKEGDLLCFKNAGAYCFSMASNYNSRYRPAEVLVHQSKAHLIREREQFKDLMRLQVDTDLFFD